MPSDAPTAAAVATEESADIMRRIDEAFHTPVPSPNCDGAKFSPSIAQIAAALALAQGKFPEIEKDQTAKIQTRTGGEYSYDYADLATLISATRGPLSEAGLAVTQPPRLQGANVTVTTLLTHVSGEWMLSEMTMPVSDPKDPKAVASAITYARRYGYSAMLGIAARDEDDDAQAASRAPRQQAQRRERQEARREQPAEREPEPEVAEDRRRINKAEQDRLKKIVKDQKVNVEQFAGYMQETYGYDGWASIERRHYDIICQLALNGMAPAAEPSETE